MNMIANADAFNGIVIEQRGGVLMASSREVAQNFGKQHKDVLRAIRNLDCSPDFNARNFAPVEYLDAKGEARAEYGMTRDGFTFLVMGFTGKDAAAWKERYIAAFNAMEARLRQQPVALTGAQLMAAALIEADATMKAQAVQIEAMKVDVAALDRLAKADGSLCFRDAAKSLQVRPIDLTQFMATHHWTYRQGQNGPWLAYQEKINSGYLEHKVTTVDRSDGTEKAATQCRITPKGLSRLAKLIGGAA